MDANQKTANATKAATILRNLEKRQITGHYVETGEEARTLLLTLLTPGCSVGWGGSATIDALQIKPLLREKGFRLIDRDTAKTPAEREEKMRESLLADAFLMSTNAITMNGELLNIDGNGNRVAALCYGPKKVIVIAGMNKVTTNVEDAYHRVKLDACVPNATRFHAGTPCERTGICGNCVGPASLCDQIVLTRNSKIPDRLHVILINEVLGF